MRIFAIAFLASLAFAGLIFALSYRDSKQHLVEFLDIRGLRRFWRQIVARSKFSLLSLVLFTTLAPAIFFLCRPIFPLLNWFLVASISLVATIAITLVIWSVQDIRWAMKRKEKDVQKLLLILDDKETRREAAQTGKFEMHVAQRDS